MRIGHAHGTELLGHLRNSRRSRWDISLGHRLLHLGCRIYPIHRLDLRLRHGLLVSGHWLRRVLWVATTGWHLASQGRIGTRAKRKRFSSIRPLLLTRSLALRHSGLSGSTIVARLAVLFLGRVTPLWFRHGENKELLSQKYWHFCRVFLFYWYRCCRGFTQGSLCSFTQ